MKHPDSCAPEVRERSVLLIEVPVCNSIPHEEYPGPVQLLGCCAARRGRAPAEGRDDVGLRPVTAPFRID